MLDIKIIVNKWTGLFIKGLVCDNKNKIHLWKSQKGKDNADVYLGEFNFNVDVLEDVTNKVKAGLVKCNVCGKWIRQEDAKFFIPTGCSCNDCNCIRTAQSDMDELMSVGLE